jgi:hypothetical protein
LHVNLICAFCVIVHSLHMMLEPLGPGQKFCMANSEVKINRRLQSMNTGYVEAYSDHSRKHSRRSNTESWHKHIQKQSKKTD